MEVVASWSWGCFAASEPDLMEQWVLNRTPANAKRKYQDRLSMNRISRDTFRTCVKLWWCFGVTLTHHCRSWNASVSAVVQVCSLCSGAERMWSSGCAGPSGSSLSDPSPAEASRWTEKPSCSSPRRTSATVLPTQVTHAHTYTQARDTRAYLKKFEMNVFAHDPWSNKQNNSQKWNKCKIKEQDFVVSSSGSKLDMQLKALAVEASLSGCMAHERKLRTGWAFDKEVSI